LTGIAGEAIEATKFLFSEGMKRSKLLSISLALVITATILVSCEMTGEGEVMNMTFGTEPFTGIVNTISANIHLTRAPDRSVEIIAQQNIIDNILLEVKEEILTISFRENARHYDPININISMPDLSSYYLSGSGSMDMTNAFDSCKTVRMEISGSGSINANLTSSSIIYSVISGSGNISYRGSSPAHDIRINGSGDMRAFQFNTNQSVVNISGSGFCEVTAENALNVMISGSGNVYYKGHPVINSSITGSGKIYNSN
jgi:hypothetical protein